MRFTPVSPAKLVDLLAESVPLTTRPSRVALDGPQCANLTDLAVAVAQRLRSSGRRAEVIAASGFYRDASLRWEYGKTDLESFYAGWLDEQSLQREVLTPSQDEANPRYLPSLRDPVSNRSTRVEPITLERGSAIIVVGELLLGKGLSFDVTIHAAVSRAARKRQSAPNLQWTLPAYDRYDIDLDPSKIADVLVRYDDPAHPAIAIR